MAELMGPYMVLEIEPRTWACRVCAKLIEHCLVQFFVLFCLFLFLPPLFFATLALHSGFESLLGGIWDDRDQIQVGQLHIKCSTYYAIISAPRKLL